MMALFLLSLALLGFWTGWRARHCKLFFYDEDQWINWLFLPVFSLLVWFGFFIFAFGRGWL